MQSGGSELNKQLFVGLSLSPTLCTTASLNQLPCSVLVVAHEAVKDSGNSLGK